MFGLVNPMSAASFPVSGKYLVRRSIGFDDLMRFKQQAGVKAFGGDAPGIQLLFDRHVACDAPRRIKPVPVDCINTGFAGDCLQYIEGGHALSEYQVSAQRLQAVL